MDTPDKPDRADHPAERQGPADTAAGRASPSPSEQGGGAESRIEQDASPGGADTSALRERIVDAIRGVYDPEIPVNIYDLGLIYEIEVNERTGRASVLMTLTTPNCPEAQVLPGHVQNAVESVEGVKEADVQIVWDPPWTPDKMSDEAKLELGMM